jgi:hypothetical protein
MGGNPPGGQGQPGRGRGSFGGGQDLAPRGSGGFARGQYQPQIAQPRMPGRQEMWKPQGSPFTGAPFIPPGIDERMARFSGHQAMRGLQNNPWVQMAQRMPGAPPPGDQSGLTGENRGTLLSAEEAGKLVGQPLPPGFILPPGFQVGRDGTVTMNQQDPVLPDGFRLPG